MNTFYENELYPLQDKVLAAIETLKTPFYLTGGTALSRCYYQHRYSEDLDLFVNKDPDFILVSESVIQQLAGLSLQINHKSEFYYSFQIEKILKIELVNDVAAHFGEINSHTIFSRIDNPINILSNKITALISRDEPKDIADIWIITQNNKINWPQIFTDASSKAIGIFPPTVAERLETFPLELLDQIKWVEGKQPDVAAFKTDINQLTSEILKITTNHNRK